MNIPDDRMYSNDHIWIKIEDNACVLGVTDHAQSSMGAIEYIDLLATGAAMVRGESYGCAESAKAVTEMPAPFDALVIEINGQLAEEPERVNNSPYGDGWMLRVINVDSDDLQDLMDAVAYRRFLE